MIARMRKWLAWWRAPRVLKANADKEYEALAREFAQLTARCLEAEQRLTQERHDARPWIEETWMLRGKVARFERDREALRADVPGLTPGELERLAVLSEECGEVVRAIGKIQRYGFESTSPFSTSGRTNRMVLEREIGSVRAIVNLMQDAGDVRLAELQGWQKSKRMALAKWTLYQDCSMPRDAQLVMMAEIRASAAD